jgi:hypothetical protein
MACHRQLPAQLARRLARMCGCTRTPVPELSRRSYLASWNGPLIGHAPGVQGPWWPSHRLTTVPPGGASVRALCPPAAVYTKSEAT